VAVRADRDRLDELRLAVVDQAEAIAEKKSMLQLDRLARDVALQAAMISRLHRLSRVRRVRQARVCSSSCSRVSTTV